MKRILDLYCGAGGCSVGYERVGFEMLGVDHLAQQNYPFDFIKMDALKALEYLNLDRFDAIHASPPCQSHSSLRYRNEDRADTGEMLAVTREALIATGKPYVIENVVGAPMEGVVLCGSMFGLDLRRHRIFESNFPISQPDCQHEIQTPKYVNPDKRGPALIGVVNVYGKCSYKGERELRERAMGIDWMSNRELTQAVPPAYTAHVGVALKRHLYRESVDFVGEVVKFSRHEL